MLSLSLKVRGEIGRNVYGEGTQGAVYYHGGHYYNGDGEYLYSNPETNPPPGAVRRPQAPALESVPAPAAPLPASNTGAIGDGAAGGTPAAPILPTIETQPGTQPESPVAETTGTLSQEDREKELMDFTVPQLQKLQRAAGVLEEKVIKGEGAKAKLIKWLLDNTSA